MKTLSFLFAFLLSVTASVLDLSAQSASTKDRIREAYSYEETTSAPETLTAHAAVHTTFYSVLTEELLTERLTIKQRPPKDPLERITFCGVIKDDSFLSNMADGIMALDSDYRKIRGGMDYNFMGQPMTLYVHSRLVIKTGKYENVVLTWSGKVTIAQEWKF